MNKYQTQFVQNAIDESEDNHWLGLGNGRLLEWDIKSFSVRENDVLINIHYTESGDLDNYLGSKTVSMDKNKWLQFIRPIKINEVIGEL